jgi:GxxExxY protein
MYFELLSRGFKVEANKQIKVYYKEMEVGLYYADLLVENTIILELKAADNIIDEFENQLLNYLRATNIEVGLLLNFGVKPQFKRKVFDNSRKNQRLPKVSV